MEDAERFYHELSFRLSKLFALADRVGALDMTVTELLTLASGISAKVTAIAADVDALKANEVAPGALQSIADALTGIGEQLDAVAASASSS